MREMQKAYGQFEENPRSDSSEDIHSQFDEVPIEDADDDDHDSYGLPESECNSEEEEDDDRVDFGRAVLPWMINEYCDGMARADVGNDVAEAERLERLREEIQRMGVSPNALDQIRKFEEENPEKDTVVVLSTLSIQENSPAAAESQPGTSE